MEYKDRGEIHLEKMRESNKKSQKLIDDIKKSLEESKKGPPSQRKENEKI